MGRSGVDARAVEDKPIFLSIGYAACHWCHVMAHESFEDAGTAAILNANFVCIKVDREERPDLDAIYMQATTSMTGSAGWPMSVFLTPDLRPFFAGTYFPPVRRYNMPAFPDLLLALAKSWLDDRAQILDVANRVRLDLEQSAAAAQTQPPSEALLTQAETNLVERADRQHGGWGRAPKFPQPMALEFLLRRAGVGYGRTPPGPGSGRRDPANDVQGRHVRCGRRRLRALLNGRPVAGAALREDAVRQRAARPGLFACPRPDG